MDILNRLLTGDLVKFVNEDGKTRVRRVLTADGSGCFRVYGLSSAGKKLTSKSLSRAFVHMTASELKDAGYTLVS